LIFANAAEPITVLRWRVGLRQWLSAKVMSIGSSKKELLLSVREPLNLTRNDADNLHEAFAICVHDHHLETVFSAN
jgi:hypothetical protein